MNGDALTIISSLISKWSVSIIAITATATKGGAERKGKLNRKYHIFNSLLTRLDKTISQRLAATSSGDAVHT